VMPVQFAIDHGPNAIRVAEHLIVPKADDPIPFGFDQFRPLGVQSRIVLPSIDFDDEFRTVTCEIRDVIPDRHLFPKMPVWKAFSKYRPKLALRLRHLATQPSGSFDCSRRWMMLQLAPPLDGEGCGKPGSLGDEPFSAWWGDVFGKVACVSTITPSLPSPIKGEDYCGFFSAGATYGLNAPPGTAEATGLSKPSLLTEETPNTQSSTRMCGSFAKT